MFDCARIYLFVARELMRAFECVHVSGSQFFCMHPDMFECVLMHADAVCVNGGT